MLCLGQDLRPYGLHLDDQMEVPAGEIYDVVEDLEHQKWIASGSGLYKIGMNQFELYRSDKQFGQSVFNPIVDSRNRVWFTNLKGQVFCVEDEKVNLKYATKDYENGFMPLLSSNDQAVQVVTRKEILSFPYKQKGYISHPIVYDGFPVTKITELNEGQFLLHGRRLLKYDSLKGYEFVQKAPYFPSLGGTILFQMGTRLIYFYQDSIGFHFVDLYRNQESTEIFNELKGLSIVQITNHKNQIWFCTSAGLFIYEMIDGLPVFQKRLMESRVVTSAIIDFKGDFWITTYRNGIYIFRPRTIEEFVINDPNYFINDFIPDANGGLYAIQNEAIFHHYNPLESTKPIDLKRRNNNQRLFHDSDSDRFFLQNTSLYEIKDDALKKRFDQPGLKDFDIINDRYLISNYANIYLLDKDFKTEHAVKGRTQFSVPGENVILSLHQGSMVLFDFDLHRIKQILYQNKPLILTTAVHLQHDTFLGINEDKELLRIKLDNDILSVAKVENPNIEELQTELVDIVHDSPFVYGLTRSGIFRWQPATDELIITRLDNLLNWKGMYKLKKGPDALWVQDRKRIYKLTGAFIPETLPQLHLSLNSISTLKEQFPMDQATSLPHSYGGLLIKSSIKGLAFDHGYALEYKWSPEEAWQPALSQPSGFVIPQVKSGNYTLHLRKHDPLTGAFTLPLSIPLMVDIAFYQSAWFWLCTLIMLLIFGFVVYTWRSRYLEKQLEKKLTEARVDNQLTMLKLENLRSQMNPHFIFNSLNSIQDYILSNDKKLAAKFLVRFSRLMRVYLNHSQQTSITLQQEIDTLDLYLSLEQDRFDKSFDYEIKVDDTIEPRNFMVPSLFLQPYVENSVNHGLHHKHGPKEIKVHVEEKPSGYLQIHIEDNGIGRESSRQLNAHLQHESFSTRANDTRISLMKQYHGDQLDIHITDLRDRDNQPLGTRVSITLPLIHKRHAVLNN